MNTGNLQLQGILLFLGELIALLKEKELLDGADVQKLLARAETGLDAQFRLPQQQAEAALFPIRFLLAREFGSPGDSFRQTARHVGASHGPEELIARNDTGA